MMRHVVAEFEARGWSLTEFLRHAQMRRVRWDALIESGGRVMSPDDADCLARAFGTSAELWRNLAARVGQEDE